jgi:hypothetical protein
VKAGGAAFEHVHGGNHLEARRSALVLSY